MNPLARTWSRIVASSVPSGARGPRTQAQHTVNPWDGMLGTRRDEEAPKGMKAYRAMVDNPTVYLGLYVAKAPLYRSEWSVEQDKNYPNPKAAKVLESYVLPLRDQALRYGAKAIEFGWGPFEIIWGIDEGYQVPLDLKPLKQEITEPRVDKKSGAFLGLKNGPDLLEPHECLVISLDPEPGQIIGRSRLESIRAKAWWPWERLADQMDRYAEKVSGPIPIIRYPQGTDTTSSVNGTDKNREIAIQVLHQLASSKGLTIPQVLPEWGLQMINAGMDPSKIAAWSIEFLETKGNHGGELAAMAAKYEALMLRGLCVPERAAIEGQFGTKAEAESHGDLASAMAQDTQDQILRQLNQQVSDRVLEANFGPQAKGRAFITAAPVVKEDKAFVRQIATAIFTSPANADLATGMLDLDAIAKETGLPTQATAQQAQDAAQVDPANVVAQLHARSVRLSQRRDAV